MLKQKTSVWSDLIVALLSVYNISLEKVDAMAPQFKQNGLTDPQKLAAMSHEEINQALCQSGYDRGNLNGIFIPRLIALAAYIVQKDPAKCEKILSSGQKTEIETLLLPIKGVGPKVLELFFLLRGIE
jgi:3-methyladenine DNA glycosylase/8-oxoguanine DNA glycosylase